MGRLQLLFWLIVTCFLGLAEPAIAQRLALVIGNSNYQNVPPLKNPSNDATLIAASLEKVGFEVTLLKDQDQRAMKLALLEFGRKLKQGVDAGLIYYAGHGIEVDGRNYLVPVDSNTQSEREADISNIDLDDVMALLEDSGVPFNILILDACRNNPFRGFRSQRGGLAPVNAPVGTYVAYSTAPGTVAADGDGDNSPFTKALAQQLATPGLTIESVFKNTRSAVRKISDGKQVPFDSSAIEGDFYFTPAPALVPPKAPEPTQAIIEPKIATPPEPVIVPKKAEAPPVAVIDTKPEILTDTPPPSKVFPNPSLQNEAATPKRVALPKKVTAPAIKRPRAKRLAIQKARVKKPVAKKAVAVRKKSGANCFTFDGQRLCD
jgi:Caspase domain